MRLLAVDPGVVNLGYCLLEWDAGAPPAAMALCRLHEALGERRLRVLDWEVVALAGGARSNAGLLEGVVAFVQARAEMLRGVDRVVVEQQMTARMKQVAACLYGAIRLLHPCVQVSFQSASLKLAFGDLADYAPALAASGAVPLATYAQRKKAAVAAAARLGEALPAQLLAAYRGHRKKDDLADALLHGLAAYCACTAAPRAAKRPRQSLMRAAST